MTYLPVATVAAQLKISPRRLRKLLAAGRIEGAYRIERGCTDNCKWPSQEHLPSCWRWGYWIIPADFTLTPATRGPLPNYRRNP